MSVAEKLTTIAENEQKVFDAGKKSEYDTFWDNFQNFGNRTDYRHAFGAPQGTFLPNDTYCPYWVDDNFKPKYDIRLVGNNSGVFMYSGVTNIKQSLIDYGVSLDTSQCTNASTMFYWAKSKELPYLDFSNCGSIAQAFYAMKKLTKIDGIKVSDKCASYKNAFVACYYLKEVIFTGTIAVSDLDFTYCRSMNKASITSVIGCLLGTNSKYSTTFSLIAVNKAFETSEGAKDGSTSEEWLNLIDTKPNWTITLATPS